MKLKQSKVKSLINKQIWVTVRTGVTQSVCSFTNYKLSTAIDRGVSLRPHTVLRLSIWYHIKRRIYHET
jgi:hypothetical protein